MTILFAGDTHGNDQQIRYLEKRAYEHGANAIFQVGDFGYWPHTDWGLKFVEEASNAALKNGIPIYWIDGNHENHDALEGMHGVTPIAPLVYYVPRGTVLDLDGRQILGYGGAFSVDKHYRVVGATWWPQETIDYEHLSKVADRFEGLKPDILVCHDAPYDVDLEFVYAERKNEFPQTRYNRKCLQTLVDAVEPKRIITGHYHTRFKGQMRDGTPIDILDKDGTKSRSWIIV